MFQERNNLFKLEVNADTRREKRSTHSHSLSLKNSWKAHNVLEDREERVKPITDHLVFALVFLPEIAIMF